jgi:hypothetical protein
LFDQCKTSALFLLLTGKWFKDGGSYGKINVEGLPEPVARAIQAMVQGLREQLAKDDIKKPTELPVWPGMVIGPLTRDEIYDDNAR